MLFITKRKHNRILQEERERGKRLYELGLKLGQNNKGFITGKRWQEEIESIQKAKGV